MGRWNWALLLLAVLLLSVLLINTRCRTGIITTVAGDGWNTGHGRTVYGVRWDYPTGRFAGDGRRATEASLNVPVRVAVAADGSLYITDTLNSRIRKVDPQGVIRTVAGNGCMGYSGDGGPATEASLRFPCAVAVAPDGSLFIADGMNHRIRRVSPGGLISTIAGDGWTRVEPGDHRAGRFAGDGGPAMKASLDGPSDLALGPDGSLYIADAGNRRIRRVGKDGIITTIAGNGEWTWAPSGDGGPAVKAGLSPGGLAVGTDGSILVAEHDMVRKVSRSGIISTFAGGQRPDHPLGDGGPAARAMLHYAVGVAVARDGTVYIADTGNHRIRRVDRKGIITTVAGDGRWDGRKGYRGDGGPAIKANLQEPCGVALGSDGSLYIADTGNNRIRKVTWR